jgi:F420H(2)-dependent quinone reductase
VRINLTTIGRRSGEPRSVTLYAFEDGERYVVVGSRGGAARDPAWVLNLRAQPRASVRSGARVSKVLASEVTGPEREPLWRLVCDAFQRRTKRLIPLFALDSRGQD